MLKLLIAFSGIVIGIILSYLAWDELEQRKYFVIAKHILLVSLFLVESYFLASVVLWTFLALAVIFFALSLKFQHYLLEVGIYLFVSIFYFLYLSGEASPVVVASLLFLYGLPAGTLLRKP